MLFNQKEFEHKIEELKLKRGLKLFLKSKIELINKIGNNSFSFLIHEKIDGEISIQLKSEKILKYNCYCNDENYCEHLAAVIFYLQEEFLELKQFQNKINHKKERKKLTKENTVKALFFEKYVNQITLIAKQFSDFSKLNKNQLSDFLKQLNYVENKASNFNQQFYFHLAIICELTKTSKIYFSENENSLNQLIENSKTQIENWFKKGFSPIENKAFLAATYYSLKSQANFKSEIFSFLIPKVVNLIQNKLDFDNLKILLKKRKQSKNKLNLIDKKVISELQLSIMEAKLDNKIYSLKNYENTIELPIALAELEFCNKRIKKGFKILEAYGLAIKQKNNDKYIDFVDEALFFAKKYKAKEMELNYLVEKFVCGYFISETDFNYFLELHNDQNSDQVVSHLVKKIKDESVFCTFDKLAVVLLNQNRLDELVEEIKKQKNKFKLLTKIGIQNFPKISLDFIALYNKHFLNAITEAKFPYFQKQLIDLAKTYIDLLPKEMQTDIIKTLKEKLIYERNTLIYFNKVYQDII